MIRIIAGRYGRRVIRTPSGSSTRPTSDRVRESLFGSLGALVALEGTAFLDLYAGSGAIGFEALSRGAARVTFVERDGEAVKTIRDNARTLGAEAACRVESVSVSRFLGRPAAEPADVVFLDPPYAQSVDDDLRSLVANGWLREDSVVVVERDTRSAEPAWPDALEPAAQRSYGETALWYARVRAA
ncbi:MAG TPA: 16S rRNA (guanine(966)-N(2))-methyltransferase RsmD [Actinocrinis sp.]|nr:16S rRNA (guanine(966)-N(2))-methyltransferase RsmD [Actinocrinis sp.]